MDSLVKLAKLEPKEDKEAQVILDPKDQGEILALLDILDLLVMM